MVFEEKNTPNAPPPRPRPRRISQNPSVVGRGGGIFPGITEPVNQKVQIKKQITFIGKRFI